MFFSVEERVASGKEAVDMHIPNTPLIIAPLCARMP